MKQAKPTSEVDPREIKKVLLRVWEKRKPLTLERVSTIEQACMALRDGTLTAAALSQASVEAHRLTGSLGTFGFGAATEICRGLEGLLKDGATPAASRVQQMTFLLEQLRAELEKPLDG
jgi:HPt (histidine-containing phosphotransfer) domain-containing protein